MILINYRASIELKFISLYVKERSPIWRLKFATRFLSGFSQSDVWWTYQVQPNEIDAVA